MAKAQDAFADLLERMADELVMSSAHERRRFLAGSTPTPAVGGSQRTAVCQSTQPRSPRRLTGAGGPM